MSMHNTTAGNMQGSHNATVRAGIDHLSAAKVLLQLNVNCTSLVLTYLQ